MTISYGGIDPNLSPGAAITLGVEKASTSGTSVDFTGIKTGTKRIVITGVGVSTNGTSPLMIQLGDAGGFEAAGYTGSSFTATAATQYSTAGFQLIAAMVAAGTYDFKITLDLEDVTGFTWGGNSSIGRRDAALAESGVGSKSLSAELTQVRITTVGGVNTFDAGAINISTS